MLMFKDTSISQYVTWWSFCISSRTTWVLFGTTTDFGCPGWNSSWIRHWPWSNSLYQLFTVLQGSASSQYKEFNSSKHSFLDNPCGKLWKIIAQICSLVKYIFFNKMNFKIIKLKWQNILKNFCLQISKFLFKSSAIA